MIPHVVPPEPGLVARPRTKTTRPFRQYHAPRPSPVDRPRFSGSYVVQVRDLRPRLRRQERRRRHLGTHGQAHRRFSTSAVGRGRGTWSWDE